MDTAYKNQGRSAWGNMDQCQLVFMKETFHYLFINIKCRFLHNILLAFMLESVLVVAKAVGCLVHFRPARGQSAEFT